MVRSLRQKVMAELIGTTIGTVEALPPEILQKIINHLSPTSNSQFHTKNLYNCVLVCKQWCKVTAPILWERPFAAICHRHHKVITIFLAFLSDSERRLLLPREFWGRSFWTKVVQRPRNSASLTFDYPHFVRHLDYTKMHRIITRWCRDNDPDFSQPMSNVFKAVLMAMMARGAKITQLSGDYTSHTNGGFCNFLAENPEFREFFSGVNWCRLDCSPFLKRPVLFDILPTSDLCLKSLEILPELWFFLARADNHEYLGTSIAQLKRISRLSLRNFRGNINTIIDGLLNKSENVTHLTFSHVDFKDCPPMTIIAQCRNLESLAFLQCKNLTLTALEPVLDANFGKMEEFQVIECESIAPEMTDFINRNVGRFVVFHDV
ncbi:hypothetical protein G9A89_017616 [Geosiphon pyriformis]|nr:hypothetical protein G9A89_017616 [Geosiphon pyriformis]